METFTTHAWTNQGQNNGGYIIIDLGTSTPLYDVTIVTADGKPHLYDADIQISSDQKKSGPRSRLSKNDNTKVEPPYRYVRANAQGAKSRYLRILVTDDVIGKYDNPFLCTKKLNLQNIEENTSTYPIASSAEGNLAKMYRSGSVHCIYNRKQNCRMAGI